MQGRRGLGFGPGERGEHADLERLVEPLPCEQLAHLLLDQRHDQALSLVLDADAGEHFTGTIDAGRRRRPEASQAGPEWQAVPGGRKCRRHRFVVKVSRTGAVHVEGAQLIPLQQLPQRLSELRGMYSAAMAGTAVRASARSRRLANAATALCILVGIALIALDGGPDGLDPHRRILAGAPKYLRPGGRVFLEIAYDQSKLVDDDTYQAIIKGKDGQPDRHGATHDCGSTAHDALLFSNNPAFSAGLGVRESGDAGTPVVLAEPKDTTIEELVSVVERAGGGGFAVDVAGEYTVGRDFTRVSEEDLRAALDPGTEVPRIVVAQPIPHDRPSVAPDADLAAHAGAPFEKAPHLLYPTAMFRVILGLAVALISTAIGTTVGGTTGGLPQPGATAASAPSGRPVEKAAVSPPMPRRLSQLRRR